MLRNLNIRNIAVIERADIDFAAGFNVLTGETGAGKSILIDSINAVLGERTSRGIVRSGCEQAYVSAVFEGLGVKAREIIAAENLITEDDGSLIIERKINADGKSAAKIGGVTVAAATVKLIANALINIHGQHDSQTLLNRDSHIDFIDGVAENLAVKDEYRQAYRAAQATKKELIALEQSADNRAAREDYLKYQIEELSRANLQAGEYEKLKNLQKIARQAESLTEALAGSAAALSGEGDGISALAVLQSALKDIKIAAKIDEKYQELEQKLSEAYFAAEDAANGINHALGEMKFSVSEQAEIEERLELIYRLCKKYDTDEQGLINALESAQEELDDDSTVQEKIAKLAEKLDETLEKVASLAEKVTKSRKNAAENFEKQILNELQFLNMPGVVFKVKIEKSRYTISGADDVEFLISANLGEDLKPLNKVASGGELSRIMLAIKNVLSERDDVDTLIFDEIDSGISGVTASRVGEKLEECSKSRQIIVVTHLAQIAAKGDNHFLIEKNMADGRTFTDVKNLAKDERKFELARIISGGEASAAVLESAEELLRG